MISIRKRIKRWKPIHLCWLFEKYGIAIPKYFIGAAAGTVVLAGSRIANATRTWQELEGIDVTGWTKTNPFIYAIASETEAGKKATKTLSIRWRNKTEAGSFAALSATGELKWPAGDVTDLEDGTAVIEAEKGCTPSGAQTWMDGTEREGANDVSFDTNSADVWEEDQWAIDCSGAQDGDEYEFELYNVTDSLSLGTCATTITMAGGVSYKTLSGSAGGTGTVTTAPAKVQREISGDVSSTSGADAIFSALMEFIGSAGETSGATAALIKLRDLIGSAGSTSTADAILKVFATVSLIGTAGSTSGVTGVFEILKELIGSAGSTSGATGNLTQLRELISSAGSTSGATGDLKSLKELISSAGSTSGSTGLLKAQKEFISSAGETSSALAVLTLIGEAVTLSGDAEGISSVTSVLSALMELIGSAGSTSGATASLTKLKELIGSADGISDVTGLLKLNKEISSSVSSTSTALAVLTKAATGALSGSVSGTSGASANILYSLRGLFASVSGTSGASAILDIVSKKELLEIASNVSMTLNLESKIYKTLDLTTPVELVEE